MGESEEGLSPLERALNDISIAEELVICAQQEGIPKHIEPKDAKGIYNLLEPYLEDFRNAIERHRSVLEESGVYEVWTDKLRKYSLPFEELENEAEKAEETVQS